MGLKELRRAALEIFGDVLARVDARAATLDALRIRDSRLQVFDAEFDLHTRTPKLYSIAVGKAAHAMASALEERLGERVTRGVVSAPPSEATLPDRWRVFAGGHPLPNEASLGAARAAFDLLREADDDESALIIFLVSGGGSALVEWPRDERLTLEDLREANRVLVSCGANITEVNAVRRALSAVKGGGLASLAPRAALLTLIISDTGAGRESDVASGPSLRPAGDAPSAAEVVARYGLASRLPPSVARSLEQRSVDGAGVAASKALRRHYVLLDNARAREAAAESARARDFAVETAADVAEQEVGEGAALMASRLFEFYERVGAGGRRVCLVSGGEFACPVRGGGVGGRNAETALRCAFEFEKLAGEKTGGAGPEHVVALCAGTDGVDGNSPAAGAMADSETLRRARERGLDAARSLAESDAHTFFDALGDALHTGPTGTNVRDIRITLAE